MLLHLGPLTALRGPPSFVTTRVQPLGPCIPQNHAPDLVFHRPDSAILLSSRMPGGVLVLVQSTVLKRLFNVYGSRHEEFVFADGSAYSGEWVCWSESTLSS